MLVERKLSQWPPTPQQASSDHGQCKYFVEARTVSTARLSGGYPNQAVGGTGLASFLIRIQDAGKKVFLILDNLRVHHSKLVKAWVAEREDQIELFYLPSYSPQLNPEERLNADLKQEMGKRVPVRTKARLRDAASEHMSMLEQCPERVIGYFQDRRVQYAA